MSGGRRVLALIAALALVLVAAGSALAVTGEITAQECIEDNDALAGDTCSRDIDGLGGGVVDAAASPDGRSLYAVSVGDDAIVHFYRGPTGVLTPLDCTDDDDGGADDCKYASPGLDGAFSVAVSPDGASVYVASFDDDAIVRFERDPETGSLSSQGCVDDSDAGQGADSCALSVDGLDGVVSVTVSPDGRSVYAASLDDDAIVRFGRNAETGALTAQGCLDDDDSGTDNCAQSADGLDGARSVAVSPDGESVYTAAGPDDAVAAFSRDPVTGRLAPEGCIDDNDSGADDCAQSSNGLDGARAVAVTPDGASVYAGSQIDDAIVRFERDPGDNSLDAADCVDDDESGADACAQSADGLGGLFSLSISADALSLYTAALDDDAVASFALDPQSGALSPQGCVDDNDPPDGPDDCARSADGLGGALGVVSSPGTTSLYAQSVDDEAVVWFVRQDETAPQTTIVAGPPRRTKKRRAGFEFISSEPFSSFECKLDKRGFKPCPTPRSYGRQLLRPGKHTFRVRALDEPGNTDTTPARWNWRVRG